MNDNDDKTVTYTASEIEATRAEARRLARWHGHIPGPFKVYDTIIEAEAHCSICGALIRTERKMGDLGKRIVTWDPGISFEKLAISNRIEICGPGTNSQCTGAKVGGR